METPCLTQKTCRKRYFRALAFWFFPAALFLVGTELHLWVIAALFGFTKLLVVGYAGGEAVYWHRLQAATRRHENLLDPLFPSMPEEKRLPLHRYRLTGGTVNVALALSISLPLALIAKDSFVLLISLPPLLSFFWALHRYRKALTSVQSVAPAPIAPLAKSYSLEEIRQEIRRQ